MIDNTALKNIFIRYLLIEIEKKKKKNNMANVRNILEEFQRQLRMGNL
jgi:hypothetical protein